MTTKIYVFCRSILSSFTHEQKVRISIFYAHEVLPAWEQKYPTDLRPRQAVEATWQWVLSPTAENRQVADAAADAAARAAARAGTAAYGVVDAAYASFTAAHTNKHNAADAVTHAAHAFSSQKLPSYEQGQLLSFRAVTTYLQDSEPVGPVFLLLDFSPQGACTLLSEHGKIHNVDSKILHILRPI